MTALARNLNLFPGTALTLSITTPTGSVAVHVRMTKQLSQEHFDSIDVALTDSTALAAAGSEQHRHQSATRRPTLTERTASGCRTIRLVPGNYVLVLLPSRCCAAAAQAIPIPERADMRISEYEDRFRSPAPSWHQILMVAHSPDRKWRRRCCLLALTLIAAVTLTMEIAPPPPRSRSCW
jgi:hypothetical protein